MPVIGGLIIFPASSFGRLHGTTAVAGTPDEPVRRRVQVVAAGGNAHGHIFPIIGSLYTWVWADASGHWECRYLDPARRYHVIAYDHTGVHDPVIKMNLVPTVD